MAGKCTNCGHPIPSGQFRCGKCGHVAARESIDDFAGLAELGDLDTPFEPVLPRPSPTGEIPIVHMEDDSLVQDSIARESIVPKGTFASDVPAAREITAEARAKVLHEPEPAPRRDASGPVVRSASTSTRKAPLESSSQPIKVLAQAARPPFLASEILREDLSPREPGERAQHAVTRVASAVGLFAVAFGCTLSPAAAVTALGFGGLLAVDRLVDDYARRATLLTLISGITLVAITAARMALGGPPLDALLSLSVWLLPSALYLRAWHRASRSARAGVAVGVALCLSWAAATSSPSLLALGFEWQSWLPAVCWYVFCVLCLLSLLAFMGDETTGGSDAWASSFLGWFAVFAATRCAVGVWSEHEQTLEQALALVEPSFAAVCALGAAQLAAHRLGQRKASTPSVRPPTLIGPNPAETT